MIDRDAVLACTACPRLAAFLAEARQRDPEFHNRPVPPWGLPDAAIVVVGLAPGYRGANRTGKPFCGDVSGAWVYETLFRYGLATSAEPGATVLDACITNAVKCCPPANRPLPIEIRTCRERWLVHELDEARVVVAFGGIAHASVLKAAGGKGTFAHLAEHSLSGGRTLLDSFHPSPLNTYTGRMSRAAFEAVFARARELTS